MPHVLVLGATGMLGQMVTAVLSKSPAMTVTPLARRGVDGFDVGAGIGALEPALKRADYVVNCIGVVKPQIDERSPDSVRRAIAVNAVFPHDLAAAADAHGARVIHMSTDGVFSGDGGEPYYEDAMHDCTDVYGKTKSLGETPRANCLTVRCSIIGPDPIGRRGLLEWFLAQPDGSELVGFTDRMWNGVTTRQFADLCERLIRADAFGEVVRESIVHHFCPNTAVSKYELLEIFRDVTGKRVTVKPSLGPGAPVGRLLATRYAAVRGVFGDGQDMRDAVRAVLN